MKLKSNWQLILTLFLSVCFSQVKALTTFIVTSNAATGAGSLSEAVFLATSASSTEDDVLIEFNLGNNNTIRLSNLIYVNPKTSLIMDGANGEGPQVVLKMSVVSTDILRIGKPNVTLKNLEFDGENTMASRGVNIYPDGDHFTASHCIFKNFAASGLNITSTNGFVEYTRIENCLHGIGVGSEFTLGNENVIIGNGLPQGTGIKINSKRTNVRLGLATNDYENYSFIGGVETGISSNSPYKLSDMVIGGREDFREDCSQELVHDVGRGIYTYHSATEKSSIGEPGDNPSVIINRVADGGQGIYFHTAGLELNNTYLGVNPFWCDGDRPSDEGTMNIAILAYSEVEIGLRQGNVIGGAVTGLRLHGKTTKIYNNYIGIDKEDHTYGTFTKAVHIFTADHVEIKNNKIGNSSSTGVTVQTSGDLKFENNYVGVSDHLTVIHPMDYGLYVVGVETATISNNYFGSEKADMRLKSTSKVDVFSNKFDAYFNGEALPDKTEKQCVILQSSNVEVNIGAVGQGNEFVGGNKYSINAQELNSFTDKDGIDREYCTVNILSNIFNKSLNSACFFRAYLNVSVGKEDDLNSGNVFLNAPYGINYVYSTLKGRFNAHHNYMGISPSGESGVLETGIRLRHGIAGYNHSITNNTITNCTAYALRIQDTDEVRMSKNRVTNSGDLIVVSNSNLVDGNVISVPSISGTQEGDYNYLLSGSTYPNATIEIFRQREGDNGASEYVVAIPTGKGNWSYRDLLYAHKGYDGYYVTVTKDGKTSVLSSIDDICVTEEATNTGCILLSSILFAKVKPGEINKRYFELSDDILGIYSEDFLSEEMPEYMVYDYLKRDDPNFDLIPLGEGRYILSKTGGLSFSKDYQRIYTLELKNRKGITTKYKIKI